MTDRRWLKILTVAGFPVQTVTNVEVWTTEAPPSPTEPGAGTISFHYADGHAEDGSPLPVGPGYVRCGGAYYGPSGALAYAPGGIAAAAQLSDQVAAD